MKRLSLHAASSGHPCSPAFPPNANRPQDTPSGHRPCPCHGVYHHIKALRPNRKKPLAAAVILHVCTYAFGTEATWPRPANLRELLCAAPRVQPPVRGLVCIPDEDHELGLVGVGLSSQGLAHIYQFPDPEQQNCET